MGNVKGGDLGGESKLFGYEHIPGVPDKFNFDYGKAGFIKTLSPEGSPNELVLFIKTKSPLDDQQFLNP